MLNAISNSLALDPFGFPAKVVSAGAASGTASSFIFAVAPAQLGRTGVLTLQGVATGTVSSCTVALEYSADGGTTWQTYGSNSSIDVNAKTATVGSVIPGVYRLNLTFSGTGTIDVSAAAG